MRRYRLGLVQLHSRYYGKGPTKAKTHLVDDAVVSILRGGFTRVERTLLDTGKVESVYQMRRSFQRRWRRSSAKSSRRPTGRTVIAYMSSIHVDPDLAMEVFVLKPHDASDEGDPIPAEMPRLVDLDAAGPA